MKTKLTSLVLKLCLVGLTLINSPQLFSQGSITFTNISIIIGDPIMMTNMPVMIHADVPKLARQSGSQSSFIISAEGALYAWGANLSGQLGLGTRTNEPVAKRVAFPPGVSAWKTISAARDHTLAIGNDGQLYAWGADPAKSVHSKPEKQPLPAGVTGWTVVAAGNQNVAITDKGVLYRWGELLTNLIASTTLPSPTRVQTPEGVTGWSAIAVGAWHTLALSSDGRLYSWGANRFGELGSIPLSAFTIEPKLVPFPPGTKKWRRIAAADSQSFAISDDGQLYAWGLNSLGQLGLGRDTTQTKTPQPVPLPAGVKSWKAISTGSLLDETGFSVGLADNGQLYLWGGSPSLADTPQFTPKFVEPPQGVTGWSTMTAGANYLLALGFDCELYATGWNAYGQLGAGTKNLSETALLPVKNLSDLCGPRVIFIPPPQLGTLKITSPAEGATFTAPANVSIQATAIDPNGYASRVVFYANDKQIGVSELTFIRAPDPGTPIQHQFDWNNVPAGDYTITAQATTSSGATLRSLPIRIVVKTAAEPAYVKILNPEDHATFTAPGTIPIKAVAVDPASYISELSFYAGAELIGISRIFFVRAPDPGTPIYHELIWTNIPPGEYTLTARARTSAGANVVSPPVSISVIGSSIKFAATRELPDTYSPGKRFTVRIRVEPGANVQAWAVEEHPPTGWRVSEIREGGSFDNVSGTIRFGPFLDQLARTLAYDVAPPTNSIERVKFFGVASADGGLFEIHGDQSIASAPPKHPADIDLPDMTIGIQEMTAYAFAWKIGKSWKVEPNPIPLSYVTRAALLWKAGGKYAYDSTKGPAPLWWIPATNRPVANLNLSLAGISAGPKAVRHLPAADQNDQKIPVTIHVDPGTPARSYAIEETLPAGWNVSGISNDGHFDSATRTIKWGLFLDGQPRDLSYQISPGSSGARSGVVSGVASFDGLNLTIAGDTLITGGPKKVSAHRLANGHLEIKWNELQPGNYRLETSTDLNHWAPVRVFALEAGLFSFEENPAEQTGPRFYRVLPQP